MTSSSPRKPTAQSSGKKRKASIDAKAISDSTATAPSAVGENQVKTPMPTAPTTSSAWKNARGTRWPQRITARPTSIVDGAMPMTNGCISRSPPGEPSTSAIAARPPMAVSSPAVRATTRGVATSGAIRLIRMSTRSVVHEPNWSSSGPSPPSRGT